MKPLNKATMKTLGKIQRASAKAADGWASLGLFDIVHVRRLEVSELVETDVYGVGPETPGFRWHVRAGAGG